MINNTSTKPRDKRSLHKRNINSSDFNDHNSTSNSCLKTITKNHNTYSNCGLHGKNAYFNLVKCGQTTKKMLKKSTKSSNNCSIQNSFKKSCSIHQNLEDYLLDHINESTINILNNTLNNTQFIEDNFPRVLTEIEKSVLILKKFYHDLLKKKHRSSSSSSNGNGNGNNNNNKPKLNQSSQQIIINNNNNNNSNCNNMTTTTSEGETITNRIQGPNSNNTNTSHIYNILPKIDIDIVMKEYEKINKSKTKDLATLYQFYISYYRNRHHHHDYDHHGYNGEHDNDNDHEYENENEHDRDNLINLTNDPYQNTIRNDQSIIQNGLNISASIITPATAGSFTASMHHHHHTLDDQGDNNSNNNNNNNPSSSLEFTIKNPIEKISFLIPPPTPTNTQREELIHETNKLLKQENKNHQSTCQSNDIMSTKNSTNEQKNPIFNSTSSINFTIMTEIEKSINDHDTNKMKFNEDRNSYSIQSTLNSRKQENCSPYTSEKYNLEGNYNRKEQLEFTRESTSNLNTLTEDNLPTNRNYQKSPEINTTKNNSSNNQADNPSSINMSKSFPNISIQGMYLSPMPKDRKPMSSFIQTMNKMNFSQSSALLPFTQSSSLTYMRGQMQNQTQITQMTTQNDVSQKEISTLNISEDRSIKSQISVSLERNPIRPLSSAFPVNPLKSQGLLKTKTLLKSPEKKILPIVFDPSTSLIAKEKQLGSSLFSTGFKPELKSMPNFKSLVKTPLIKGIDGINRSKPDVAFKESEANGYLKMIPSPENSFFNSKGSNQPIQQKLEKDIQDKNKGNLMNKEGEIYNKIFEKNMMINKLKQDLNQNLKTLTSSCSTTITINTGSDVDNLKSQKLLNFENLKSDCLFKTEDDPEWIITKNFDCYNLDQAVIERFSDEERDASDNSMLKPDKIIITEEKLAEPIYSPSDIKQRQEQHQQQHTNELKQNSTKKLEEFQKDGLPLNQADLKLIDNLKQMADLIKEKEILNIIDKKEDDNLFHTFKKKIEIKENFKKTKWYVPEIPLRKPKVLENIDKQNEEEEKRHKHELDKFFKNTKLLNELENILDCSNDGGNGSSSHNQPNKGNSNIQHQMNNTQCNNNHCKPIENQNLTIHFDEHSFLEGLKNAELEKQNIIGGLNNITFELDVSKTDENDTKKHSNLLKQVNTLGPLTLIDQNKNFELSFPQKKTDNKRPELDLNLANSSTMYTCLININDTNINNNTNHNHNDQSNNNNNNENVHMLSNLHLSNTYGLNDTKDKNNILLSSKDNFPTLRQMINNHNDILSPNHQDKINLRSPCFKTQERHNNNNGPMSIDIIEDKLKNLISVDKKLKKVLLILKKEQDNLQLKGENTTQIEEKIMKYQAKKNQITAKIEKYSKKLHV